MWIEISRELLIKAVKKVSKAVPANSPVAALSGIKLTARHNGLTLSATNLHVTIHNEIPADTQCLTVHRTGSVVVPAKYMSSIISKCPAEQVTLRLEKQFMLGILSGSITYRLCGMNPDEFPHTEELDNGRSVHLPSVVLQQTIRQVAFAVSTSETRPILTGVSCESDERGHLRFLATDGVRLAMNVIPTAQQRGLDWPDIIIPAQHLQDLSHLLHELDEMIEVCISERQIVFKTRYMSLHSSLISGNYPNVGNLIPASCATELVLPAKSLLAAIERVSLLASDEQIIHMQLACDNLVLTSQTAEIGDVYEEVAFLSLTGEPLNISFNAKLMRDILRGADCDHMTLKFTGSLKPILLHPTGRDSPQYILSPIRTSV
ncbi:DNA polymerase III subunit beta [Paenibacillaceae bacterium]|nr:DNA polymerase III subunit beta [Paenibacillaceae bacterium]